MKRWAFQEKNPDGNLQTKFQYLKSEIHWRKVTSRVDRIKQRIMYLEMTRFIQACTHTHTKD